MSVRRKHCIHNTLQNNHCSRANQSAYVNQNVMQVRFERAIQQWAFLEKELVLLRGNYVSEA